MVTYSEKWDVNTFFSGGSDSPQLKEHLQNLRKEITEYEKKAKNLQIPSSADDAATLAEIIEATASVEKNLDQASSVIGCFVAQDTEDKKATLLQSEMSALYAKFSTSFQLVQQTMSKTDDVVWEKLMESNDLKNFAFVLNEWKMWTAERLSEKEEQLITALGVDGYHGWGQLYDMLVSDVRITMTIDGETKSYSVGQASNLSSHEDPAVRKEAHDLLEKAWAEKEEFFAKTLNHLGGFRLATYEKRGWDSVLKEPLMINRMSEETLKAMWGAIAAHKSLFVDYMNRKAEMLGVENLNWYDLDAPVSSANSKVNYQEGAEFILKHFKKFGPELESFSRGAFEKEWIEAEDRDNKRPGGFCTYMPLDQESRIFMTYSGTMSNVATLAHELGHAFHSYAMKDVHWMNTNYAMGVAETASTFAEMIVADASVKEASSKEEKIALLEDKIQRSVALFMNIYARFLFETRFYEERKEGIVSAERLNTLMEEAQREAFGDALGDVHPHFWASKLHFYITGVPFYNFPYTFGYLFSLSIYAKAKEEGTAFESKYIDLLKDTASMTVEDLAMKHLQEDITQLAFWEKGIALCEEDVTEFLSLTKK
ncbi:M3 family oligoendopeptidase [Paenisporosarcina cavernae]|nr:M3 family oligoendopeptidase [Paenisporosarcina cavernae]